MAAKKTKQVQEATVTLEKYDKDEFIAASKQVFGVPSECVVAALRNAKGPFTLDEAKKKLNEFMNMEVK